MSDAAKSTYAAAIKAAPASVRRRYSKKTIDRRFRSVAFAIVLLSSVGIVIPLLYMIGGSLSSKQVIRTVPSSIIPIEGRQVTLEAPALGEFPAIPKKKYFVYRVEIDGKTREMAYVDKKDRQWVYANPENPSERRLAPPASPDDRVAAVRLNWANYPEALTKSPFARYVMNTLAVMFFSTIGTLVSTVLVAYGFSRFWFRARDFLFIVLLSTMMLPPQVSLIPSFVMFQKIGWYDTWLPLIVPAFFAVSAWNVFLVRQFLMGLPTELDDAARIDGCGPIGILWHVIVPQSVPVIVTITAFTAVFWWNEYFYSLIYLQDKLKYTVALGLQSFDSLYYNNNAIKAAATSLMALPPIVLFFFFQRYFIQGTVVSGVKG